MKKDPILEKNDFNQSKIDFSAQESNFTEEKQAFRDRLKYPLEKPLNEFIL